MSSAESKQANCVGTGFPVPPVITSSVPAKTYADALVMEGTRRADQTVEVNGTPLPTFCYLDARRWIYSVALTVGGNAIAVTATNAFGRRSDPVPVACERIARANGYAVAFKVLRNGADVSDKVYNIRINASPVFIAGQLQFGFYSRADFAYGDAIEYWQRDAAIGETRVFVGTVQAVVETGKYPLISFDATALDAGWQVVNSTYPGNLTGDTNGAIVRFLLKRAGVAADKIAVPEGARFTGPRACANKNIWEIIRAIQQVEGWTFRVDADGTFRFDPDAVLYFYPWDFTDAIVLGYTEQEERLGYFNALKVAYIEQPEPLPGSDAMKDMELPDMTSAGEGHGFYADADCRIEVEQANVNDDLYFMAWTDKVDLTSLSRANLYLQFSRGASKQATMTESIALRALPENGILVGKFELAKYSLPTSSLFAFSFAVQDERGVYYARTSAPLALADNAAEEKTITTVYGIQTTGTIKVASVDMTWEISEQGDLPKTDEASGITFAKNWGRPTKKKKNTDETPTWDGRFLVEVNVNDVVTSSITTNLGLRGKPTGGDGDDPAIVQSCQLIHKGDAAYTINGEVYGARYHAPSAPLRRVDFLYFLFDFSRVRQGDVIRIKFEVFGRRIVDTGDYVDPATIRLFMEDTEEVARVGRSVFGGTLASGYFANKAQAANLCSRILRNHSRAPIQRYEMTIPFIAEMRPFSSIRWVSATRGIEALLFVSESVIGGDGKTMLLRGFRYTPALEFDQTTTGAKVIGITRPDLRNDLLAVFNPPERTKGLLKGKVAGKQAEGFYHIDLSSPSVRLDNVRSTIPDLADGENVLIGDYPGGGYIVVMRVDGNFLDMDDPVDLDELDGAADDYVKVPLSDASKLRKDQYGAGGAKNALDGAVSASVSFSDTFDGLVALTSTITLKFNHPTFFTNSPPLTGQNKTWERCIDNFIGIIDADSRTADFTIDYDSFTTKRIDGRDIKEWNRDAVKITMKSAFKAGAKYRVVIENPGLRTNLFHHFASRTQFQSYDGATLSDAGIVFEFTAEPPFVVTRVQHSAPEELLATLSQAITEDAEGLFDKAQDWTLLAV